MNDEEAKGCIRKIVMRDAAVCKFLEGMTHAEVVKVLESSTPSRGVAFLEIYRSHVEESRRPDPVATDVSVLLEMKEEIIYRACERSFLKDFGIVLVDAADGRMPSSERDDMTFAAFGRFLKGLTQEELMAVLKAVSPDKRLALLEIYKHIAGEGAPKGPKGEDPLPDESA